MGYADEGQKPVPPEAISPFEPKEVTYVDEPLIELDSDWNMDVKLFSKYRYTNEFVKRWKAKYGYTPTLPIMTDRKFFDAIDLNLPGLKSVKASVDRGDFSEAREEYLLYNLKRSRPYSIKPVPISKEAGETAAIEADKIMADAKFPACLPGIKLSLWTFMWYLERAYLHTKDIKYANAWLGMFNHWYVTYRPPAQRPKMYISFLWMPYWRTLGAGNSAISLCRDEDWIIQAMKLGLDHDIIFNIYKSVLEHARFLYLCNDVFMPSNWQTHQCEALIKIGAHFPSFKKSKFWCEHAWELSKQHIDKETYNDGTHCENSIGYATGVINQYFNTVRIVRKLGLEIPDEFLKKWESMYLWAVKIVPPTGNYVPCGDNGIGADGSLVKQAIIKGALEFNDSYMKYFTEQYPDDVKKIAEEEFENSAQVLAAYNKVKAEKPLFTSILLPNTGWAVMRHSWEKRSPYMFFDFGWDEAWHSHPDFGTFNIWAYGKPIVTECGRGGTYESDLSKRWYKQTIAHNTVMVDSRSMRKCVNNRLNQWWTGEVYDFADATSDGYRWIGVLHNRRILFVKPDYWIITDFLPGPSYYGTSFQTSGYHEFDWLAHFQPTKLIIDKKSKRINTTNDDANVALIPLNPDEVQVKDSRGPVSTPFGIEDAPYISLHQEGMAFVQYQVLLLPYEGGDVPEIDFTLLVTDEVDRVHRQNIGYEIAVLGRKDIFLESGNSKEKVTFGDYTLCGDVAHICDAEKNNALYLLLDTDYFAYKGELIFSSPHRIEAIEFSAKRPSELKIITQSSISGIKIYAPGVTDVEVNNRERNFSKQGNYVIIE
jgi:hypothetical protein